MQFLKYYVIGLLFLMVSPKINAQSSQKVRMGFTASPNLGWISTAKTGYESDGAKLGIKYGILMDFRLFENDNYFLASGFTINHLGFKLASPDVYMADTTNVGARTNSRYNLTYIDVPLAFRLKTKEIGYMVYYGTFGTELGFNIGSKQTSTTTYNEVTTNEALNENLKEVNLFRSSLVFGIGAERTISGNTAIQFGITYHNGMTNIFNDDYVSYEVTDAGNTLIEGNKAVESSNFNTKLSFVELNFAILF